MHSKSVESVNITPPPESPESLSLEDQTRDYSTRVEGRMDSTRLSPVIITTPAEEATFFDLNISSFPKQIPAQLPSGRTLKRKVTEVSEDDETMMKRSKWSCHLCGEGGGDRRARCTCKKYVHHSCKSNGVCSRM